MSDNSKDPYVVALVMGEETVIKALYEDYFPYIKSYVMKNEGGAEDALDLFHDALESIIHRAYNDESVYEINLKPYLYRICRNKWIDVLRKRTKQQEVRNEEKRRLEEVESSSGELEEDGDRSRYLNESLETTFRLLSDTCRALIDLMNEGLTVGEVADQMEMANANTVYRRKFACMKRWKELLSNHPLYKLYLKSNEG